MLTQKERIGINENVYCLKLKTTLGCMVQGKPQLKFERNRCHRYILDNCDRAWLCEICWHIHAELQHTGLILGVPCWSYFKALYILQPLAKTCCIHQLTDGTGLPEIDCVCRGYTPSYKFQAATGNSSTIASSSLESFSFMTNWT